MDTAKCSLSNKLLLTLSVVEHRDHHPVVQCTVGIYSEVKKKSKEGSLNPRRGGDGESEEKYFAYLRL